MLEGVVYLPPGTYLSGTLTLKSHVSLHLETRAMLPWGSRRARVAWTLTVSWQSFARGILYYFEALDEDGNAANYPDFLQRTPHFAIDSWAP